MFVTSGHACAPSAGRACKAPPSVPALSIRACAGVLVLTASLVFSALLTAVALLTPELHWLAWFSFFPLFVAVRCLRPRMAALAGALWGLGLYLFSTAGSTASLGATASGVGFAAPGVSPSGWLLALLILIPAVYTGLAARRMRAIGFKLLTLALGWTLLEVVLQLYQLQEHRPVGVQQGLLTGSHGEIAQLHWLARLLAYVSTAFLVACVNASLVSILSGTRLTFPPSPSLAASADPGAWNPPHLVPPIQSWILRQAQPRAPPIQLNLVT